MNLRSEFFNFKKQPATAYQDEGGEPSRHQPKENLTIAEQPIGQQSGHTSGEPAAKPKSRPKAFSRRNRFTGRGKKRRRQSSLLKDQETGKSGPSGQRQAKSRKNDGSKAGNQQGRY
jgi:hypothetical protein